MKLKLTVLITTLTLLLVAPWASAQPIPTASSNWEWAEPSSLVPSWFQSILAYAASFSSQVAATEEQGDGEVSAGVDPIGATTTLDSQNSQETTGGDVSGGMDPLG